MISHTIWCVRTGCSGVCSPYESKAEIADLRAQLADAEKRASTWLTEVNRRERERLELQTKLALAVEALGIYASTHHPVCRADRICACGLAARETLAKLNSSETPNSCAPDTYTLTPKAQCDDTLGTKLHSTMDAVVWAREFMRIFSGHVCGPDETIDEGLMIGWFANAIMTGYDTANNRKQGSEKVPPVFNHDGACSKDQMCNDCEGKFGDGCSHHEDIGPAEGPFKCARCDEPTPPSQCPECLARRQLNFYTPCPAHSAKESNNG